MKSWQCASGWAAGLALSCAFSFALGQSPPLSPTVHVANELVLAGLRPGKDTFATAEKKYKAKSLRASAKKDDPKEKDDPGEKEWWDSCNGRSLKLELDAKGVIQSVTVTALAPRTGECKRADIFGEQFWVTGRGLKLGDPRDRIIDLYGEPNSSGPSVKGTRELELLFYTFDWAGSEVPQVMEISCERSTGKVLEITLAFPGL